MKKQIMAISTVAALALPSVVIGSDTKISDAEGTIKIINLYELEKEASNKESIKNLGAVIE